MDLYFSQNCRESVTKFDTPLAADVYSGDSLATLVLRCKDGKQKLHLQRSRILQAEVNEDQKLDV